MLAIGVENPQASGPAAQNIALLHRVVGAVLTRLPVATLVQPWQPPEWRKRAGLPGNASKAQVSEHGIIVAHDMGADWTMRDHPQDCFDALVIALATRDAIRTDTP